VPPREFPAGTRLQIPFEFKCGILFVELDHYKHSPGPVSGGVLAPAGIMGLQSRDRIGGHADVVLARVADALENVDKPFWLGHLARSIKFEATSEAREI
jgi:hypothetical protein